MLKFVLLAALVSVTLAGYCQRKNLDCGGHDIRSFKADAATCKTACNGNAECKSIQVFGGTCWLKRYACTNNELKPLITGSDYVKSDNGCKEYKEPRQKYCKRADLDCGGHDIVRVGGVADLRTCQFLCNYKTECKSIQFLGTNCWLKRHACTNDELKPLNGGVDAVKIDINGVCTQYKKPRTKYCHRVDMDCPGHDIHALTWVKSVSLCKYLCDFNSACKSIQYRGNRCWLKRHACSNNELKSLPDYNDYVKVVAGGSCADYKIAYSYRYCARDNKDCGGHDILSTKVDTVEDCQDLCSYKEECKSIQYLHKTCWLKRYVCKNSELKPLNGGTDQVKIARSGNCKKELAKLA